MLCCKKTIWLITVLCGILFSMMTMLYINQQGSLLGFVSQIPIAALVRAELQSPLTTAIKPRSAICACQSCLAEKGNSEWFDQRYDFQLLPFFTAQNHTLHTRTMKWWLTMQYARWDPKLQEVVNDIFKFISNPLPNWTPHQDKCRRCAIVGNSVNLLRTNFGPLIDSHPTVIRMNRARTIGYERHVGNRTTYHVVYPESAIDLQPGVYLVLLPFKPRDFHWLASGLASGKTNRTYMKVRRFVKVDTDKVLLVNPKLMKNTFEQWTEHHRFYPSTGMMAIVMALHICDELSVFGYGADEGGNWQHYWENILVGGFKKTGSHDGIFEMQVIQKLAALGKIQLYTS